METLIISSLSSFEYRDLHPSRAGRPVGRPTRVPRESRSPKPLQFGAPTLLSGGRIPADEQARLDALDIPLPIHILTPKAHGKKHSAVFTPRVCTTAIFSNDIDPTGQLHTYVCKAEQAFVQACAGLSEVKALELGMQLMGTYRRPRRQAIPYYAGIPGTSMDFYPHGSDAVTCSRATVYNVAPVLSLASMHRYVREHEGAYGTRRISRLLPHLHAGLASPLEAQAYLLTFLPRAWGGLGCTPPDAVNEPLALGAEAAAIAEKHVIVPDFLWRGARVAVEINGARDHAGPRGIAQTSRREKAYRAMGIDCLTLTADEIGDQRAMETFASELVKALGGRFRRPSESCRQSAMRIRRELCFDGRHTEQGQLAVSSEPDPGWFDAISSHYDRYGC